MNRKTVRQSTLFVFDLSETGMEVLVATALFATRKVVIPVAVPVAEMVALHGLIVTLMGMNLVENAAQSVMDAAEVAIEFYDAFRDFPNLDRRGRM